MIDALHAEWTKQRTVQGPAWLLLGAITLTVALSAIVAAAVTYASAGVGQDLTIRLGFAGCSPVQEVPSWHTRPPA